MGIISTISLIVDVVQNITKSIAYLSDKIGNFKVRSWLDGSTFSNKGRIRDRTRVLDSNELIAGWLGKVPSYYTEEGVNVACVYPIMFVSVWNLTYKDVPSYSYDCNDAMNPNFLVT
jgi:hypothetical protein